MTMSQPQQFETRATEGSQNQYGKVILNKERFVQIIDEILAADSLPKIRLRIAELRPAIATSRNDSIGIVNIASNGDTISMRRDVLSADLGQISESQTLERAIYYLNRLKASIVEVKTSKINEINLKRWKEYDEVLTDSLWIVPKRDTSGAHVSEYWGNFVPQIPRQMMIRYTKRNDWVLDVFAGSGTTLIECRRLGRNGLGIELNPKVAQRARELVETEPNLRQITTDIAVGDNTTLDIKDMLAQHQIEKVQLLMMHPPYHNIIRFSEDKRDLSNAETTEDFLTMFGRTVDNATPFLEKGRYLALVIGDKYAKGEWIPLGFSCMNEVLKRGYMLKAVVVKNFDETKGKRNQQELWRYRALVGGFYIFKHEYIMIFKKQ
ncbi:MAG: hypothetical protein KJZ86_06085 [Caldilineaceae bacterium]|nr:hypothetical protein [Caldilineaceae bacterium]